MEYEHEEIREQAAPVEEKAPATALTAVSAKKKAPRLNPPEPPAVPALPQEGPAPDPNERVPVVDVQFRPGSKIYFFDPGNLELKNGDHVIIDTARGAEYGYCLTGNHRIARRELVQPLRRVLRIATPIDRRIKTENEKKEKEAYAFCLRKIEELGLDMQLVSAECAFDGSKLLFFFTADNRVDFRELVRILASNYHTRIELRQIGVRDKAKMLGGLGICGRPFCCSSFLEDFQPVSIKMAKTQNLSLNPTKISGTCGRLMCCLKYEQEAYEDLIKTSPKPESFVDTPDGRGTVTAVNLMRQSVNVRMEKDEDEIHCYRNSEICVLRSGKGKKTDPPIPEDLAPISGRKDGTLRERRPYLEQRLTLDPAEEERMDSEPGEEAESAPEQPSRENRSRRGRRERRGDRTEQPENASRKETPQPAAPASREEGQSAPAEGSRRSRRSSRGEKPENQRRERPEKPEKSEKPELPDGREKNEHPSRSQRRRQQQGKQEPRLPQPEQLRRPAPEKPAADQPAPKPEGKKNNKRRYYHNRKPKG